MKIVYQGSPGAYSHLAAKIMYPDYEPISQNTFEECFNLCLKNEGWCSFQKFSCSGNIIECSLYLFFLGVIIEFSVHRSIES